MQYTISSIGNDKQGELECTQDNLGETIALENNFGVDSKKIGNAKKIKVGNSKETEIINEVFKDHQDSLNMSSIERELKENKLREHYIEQPLQEHALETFDVAISTICIAGDNQKDIKCNSKPVKVKTFQCTNLTRLPASPILHQEQNESLELAKEILHSANNAKAQKFRTVGLEQDKYTNL